MPEMSGDHVAVEIKRVAPDKPVLLLTGFEDLMKLPGEKPEGVDMVLRKPINIDDLLRAVVKLMESRV